MINPWAKEQLDKLKAEGELEVPTPGGESKSEFMARCMSDPYMQGKFPRQDQRVAVCLGAWGD